MLLHDTAALIASVVYALAILCNLLWMQLASGLGQLTVREKCDRIAGTYAMGSPESSKYC